MLEDWKAHTVNLFGQGGGKELVKSGTPSNGSVYEILDV